MASGLLIDYLGSGIIADRPATPTLFSGSVGLWWATDTTTLSAWDGSTWTDVTSSSGGDVVGPASSIADYVALFDGTTGKLLKQGSGTLGTAAYTAASAYATAAQGATADSAVQPGDLATIATTGALLDATDFPGGTTDFLRADGSFAAPAGGGGLTGYTATLETASPNNTNNVSRLKASGGTTTQHAVLEAKGFGGVAAQSADATSARGDARGFNTVDWQSTRANANEVASGDNSGVLWGNACKASGQYAAAGGNSAYAEGANSIAFGDNITADGDYSIGLGKSVKVKGVYGSHVRANGTHPGGLDGECQSRGVMLYCVTTNATPTRLTSNGGAAASTNQIRLNLNFQWYLVKGTVIAVEKTTGDYAMWEFTALITRNFGTSMLVACTPSLLGSAGSGSTWALTVTADASLNTLAVEGTGGASSTIRWQCDIYSSNEMGWT